MFNIFVFEIKKQEGFLQCQALNPNTRLKAEEGSRVKDGVSKGKERSLKVND